MTSVWYVKNILANCDGNLYLPILHLNFTLQAARKIAPCDRTFTVNFFISHSTTKFLLYSYLLHKGFYNVLDFREEKARTHGLRLAGKAAIYPLILNHPYVIKILSGSRNFYFMWYMSVKRNS